MLSLRKISSIVLVVYLCSLINQVSADALSFSKNARNLASWSRIHQQEFKERFLARQLVLSHEAVNFFIKQYITKRATAGRSLEEEVIPVDDQRLHIIVIPDLLKQTGQFAHLGLGRVYKAPVIYIDKNVHDDKEALQCILAHESAEIAKWEKLRNILGLRSDEMRTWIISYIDSADKRLIGSGYAGWTARRIAKHFHDNSPSLDYVYNKYADVQFNFSYLDYILAFYSQDAVDKVFYNGENTNNPNLAAGGDTPQPSEETGQDEEASSQRQATAQSWIAQNTPDLVGKTMVSLSMEGHIPELVNPETENTLVRDINTKGGLGAYQGDKLEGLADIGMNGIGIQPGYCYGQAQWDEYKELIRQGVLEPVFIGADHINELTEDGILQSGQFQPDAINVEAWGTDPLLQPWREQNGHGKAPFEVGVYRVNRGGTPVYLLLSKVFDELYTDNRLNRYAQEIVFGKAAYQLLKNKLKLAPDILHLNEAHTVVAAVQVRADVDGFFKKTAIAYTNHTLVPAGLERFSPDEILHQLLTDQGLPPDQIAQQVRERSYQETILHRMIHEIGIPEDRRNQYETIFLRTLDGRTIVDYCHAAFQLADVINAVSTEHASATERLFRALYPDDFNKKVVPILNGSGKTWINSELLALQERNERPDEDTLFGIHERGKKRALDYVRQKTSIQLDPKKPTAWAVRRITGYKSQYPLLRFIVYPMCASRDTEITKEGLEKWWDDNIVESKYAEYGIPEMKANILNMLFPDGKEKTHGLGMQLVLGGPGYEMSWVQNFIKWTYDIKELSGNVVFVPGSTATLLEMQAIGADICINMPQPLKEACGTSDQRTGLNGGVNIAIEGAGPVEWMTEYDEDAETGSGFFIGPYTRQTAQGLESDFDAFYKEGPRDLYGKLAICSRLFYKEEQKWKHLMLNAYIASTYGDEDKKSVTAESMEQRYACDVYTQALIERSGAQADIQFTKRLFDKLKEIEFKESPTEDLDNGRVYVIRYNKDRLTQELLGLGEGYTAEDLLEEYVRFLRFRVSNPENIILKPSAQGNILLSVSCYKDRSQSSSALIGTALLNMQIQKDSANNEYYYLRLPALLNIALAASSIREGIQYSEMYDYERHLLDLVKNQYLEVTGLPILAFEDHILTFIKNLVLPETAPVSLEQIDQYHRFAKRLLIAA